MAMNPELNPVRDIAERMLWDPAPALPEPDEMLAGARRYSRLRDRLLAGASGVAVLLVAGAATALVSWDPTRSPGSPGGAVSAADTPVPVARAAAEHGRWMTRLIVAAVPGHFHKASQELFDDSPVVQPTAPVDHAVVLAGSVVRVADGAAEGQVVAYLTADGRPPPTGDPCATPPAGTCWSVVVNGVPIRIVVRADVITGTRFLDGGQLSVAAWSRAPGARESLATPPLTAEKVAALTADPEMLQFA
jgi:hypothetical protein